MREIIHQNKLYCIVGKLSAPRFREARLLHSPCLGLFCIFPPKSSYSVVLTMYFQLSLQSVNCFVSLNQLNCVCCVYHLLTLSLFNHEINVCVCVLFIYYFSHQSRRWGKRQRGNITVQLWFVVILGAKFNFQVVYSKSTSVPLCYFSVLK